MNEIISYGIKVVLFHGICCAMYWTLFRRSGQFTWNRFYLLSTIVLGFVAPLVTLSTPAALTGQLNADINISSIRFAEAQAPGDSTVSTSSGWSYSIVFAIIYLAGVIVLTVRYLSGLLSVLRIRTRAMEERGNFPKVYRIREAMSFSFINTIFLQHSANDTELLHEKGHVTGRHWMDLIFMEFVCIVCWMNPFLWLYRSWLRQVHEYLADDYVLRQGVSHQDYLLCILNSLPYRDTTGPISSFNSHSLKQRIFMMTKTNFLPFLKARYVAVVPVIALLFFSFTRKSADVPPSAADKILVIDAAHGGSDAGAISASGLAEKDVALAIANFAQQIGTEKGLNVILTRNTDQELTLKERVDISAKANADVFLSVHADFDESGAHQGARMYVSEENSNQVDSRKITSALAKELKSIKGFKDVPVGNFDAYVLKNNKAASIILEVGFLSNDQDAKFLSDPKNQRMLAEKIVDGLMR